MSEAIILHRKPKDISKKQTLSLTQQEGYKIKSLIKEVSGFKSFARYCALIGMQEANFHAVLSGDRDCSIELLERILSGIRYEVLLSTTIVLQELRIGQDVTLAFYATIDEEFASEETELETSIPSDQSDCSLLERLLAQQKMEQESLSPDDVDES